MAGQVSGGGNMAAAQYLAGYNPQQQYPQAQQDDPNDELAKALALNYQPPKDHGPVYSALGGLANVASDLGHAYMSRKRTENLLNYEQGSAQAEQKAEDIAGNTQLAHDYTSGNDLNVSPQGEATLTPPNAGQVDPATGQHVASVSLPTQMQTPGGTVNTTDAEMMTPNQRAAMATQALAQSRPVLAQQMRDRLMQTAQQASPPAQVQTMQPGETGVLKNPQTGQPMQGNGAPPGVMPAGGGAPAPGPNMAAAAAMAPPAPQGAPMGGPGGPATAFSGGPPLTDDAKNLILSGKQQGTPEFKKALDDLEQAKLPEKIIPASAQQVAAAGLAPNTPATFNTKTGKVEATPAQPGESGPLYDADSGTPLGFGRYTQPDVAAKLQAGAVLPHEPKPLEGTAAESLLKLGNQTAELQAQMSRYDPSYQRIIDADSKVRGFVGGQSFNDAAEWMNNTKSILLQNTKDVAGRSPQLIEEYNAIRPESTDSADTIVRKMQNLIALKRFETAQQAGSLLKGGYLGNQVVAAAGFDPRKQPAPLPQTEQQVPAAAAGTLQPGAPRQQGRAPTADLQARVDEARKRGLIK